MRCVENVTRMAEKRNGKDRRKDTTMKTYAKMGEY
jgi:hypothetical protein